MAEIDPKLRREVLEQGSRSVKLLVLIPLALWVLSAFGCAPTDPGPGLLEPHRGGLVSQVALEGELLSSSVLAGEPDAPAALEVEAESEGAVAAVEGSSKADSDAAAAGSAGTDEQVEPAPTSPSSVEPVPPEADELSSGEYGGGAVVVQQQVAVVVEAADDSSASSEAKSDVPGEGAMPALADSAPERMPAAASADSFEPPPNVELGLGGPVDIDAVLLAEPPSDQAALDALGSLARRAPTSVSAASSPPPPCAPSDSGLLAVSLGQLSMVRAWLDGTTLRAELRSPDGRLYTVVRGDRVGGDGGRVLQVTSSQVVVGEIGFGLDGTPFIVQEAIRVRP